MKSSLAEYGFVDVPETDAETKPTESWPLPEIVDAVAFIGTPIEPPPELIEGILHTGSKLALGGNSKAFKTWTLLSLSLCVAAGAEWLGCKTVEGKVLFVNFEIQPYAWQRRIAAVARAIKIELKEGQILLWNLRGHAADFRQLIPKIIERCRAEKFALIVLDPIYKLYGGTDENSAGDVAALLNAIEELATETGAAVAYGCHFAKGNAAGKEAIDRISGSGVFARDPDSLLIFTAHEEQDAFVVEPILRNFAPIAPFVVRWKFPLMERDGELDPAKLKQIAGRKKRFDDSDLRKLLALIVSNDETNPVSIAEWAMRGNVPASTMRKYCAEMRDKDWIKTIGEGTRSKQAITNKGKEILNGTD
jgi:predicted transcriptional regulator